MNYNERWACPQCTSGNPFFQPTIYHNGTLGECTGCGTKAIRHNCCSPNPFKQSVTWLPILLTGISVACPSCKAIYQLSDQVQKSPAAPDWLKAGAAVVGAVAFIVGLIKLGEMLEDSVS